MPGQVYPPPHSLVHISLDVDALDPQFAPSTGTPVAGGLSIKECIDIIGHFRRNYKVISMDIVEVNPLVGDAADVQRTLQSAVEVFEAMLS